MARYECDVCGVPVTPSDLGVAPGIRHKERRAEGPECAKCAGRRLLLADIAA